MDVLENSFGCLPQQLSSSCLVFAYSIREMHEISCIQIQVEILHWQTLKHREIPLNIMNSLPVQASEHWHRLPRETVESLSMETFKNHLDTVLCHGLQNEAA